ncbi:MAG: extracellular solute-binding protein family 5 [Myxococcales bacterium]|nr:extracellular solute-binding protein family 5 [Myxococcales bacterium]
MIARRNVITLMVAIVVGACSPRDRRTPDDTLVVLIEAAMTSSDPRYAISNYDSKLSKLVHAGLTAVDTDSMLPRLELAAKVERAGDRMWDVELRPDARFSDGTAVTGEDVAFTYESMLAEDSDSLFHRGFTERFTKVEALGPQRVRFHLREPLATFESDIDFGIISRTGKGAGPYVVRELTTSHAVLDINPHYVGEKPKVPHVEIKFVRDASARLLMLVGGSADLIQNAVRLDLVEEVKDRPRVAITSAPSVILTYLMLNNADPLLKDVRVRQAIALSLDRPAIIAAKFGGRARLASGLMAETHWSYEPDVPHWTRDLPRARKLLDEAGLVDPDGPGPRPRARFVYKTSSDAFRVTIARVIAAQLAEVGLEVEVRSFEFATFFADVKKGTYQIASMQTGEVSDPDFYFTYYHSSRIPDATNPDGGNRWRYKNARVDELTLAGRHELDRARRKALYAEVQRLVATEVPTVPLWHEDNVVLTHVDVQGYAITPNARLIGLRKAWKR